MEQIFSLTATAIGHVQQEPPAMLTISGIIDLASNFGTDGLNNIILLK